MHIICPIILIISTVYSGFRWIQNVVVQVQLAAQTFQAVTAGGDCRHRLDLVMIRPPGIDHGAFVVSPSTVWYARVLLLFSASATTDTGSKSFECALVSTLETYDDPENVYYLLYTNYSNYVH